MTVYNFVRVGPPGGEASIHDAPPEVAAAIEGWLDGRGDTEPGSGVASDLLPQPRLGLLVLHHAISSDDRYALGLVHVVAVPEACLAAASQAALTDLFESLYGSPLSIALPKLLGALAGATPEETTARVEQGFAGDGHLEAFRSGDPGEFAPREPEPAAADASAHATRQTPPAPPRRRSGRLAAGLGLLFGGGLGIALAYSPFVEPVLPAFTSPAPQTQERLARLEQRVDRLQEQERVSRSALAELERSHADAVSQLRQALEALGRYAAATAEAKSPAAPTAEAKPPAAPTAEAEAPAAPPAVAATVAPEGRSFRVVARSARVRAGPSAKERTRGLVGQGQRVVVMDQRDAWLEIEPPPGFRAPAWIHRALVEAVEASAEDPAVAPSAEDAVLAPAAEDAARAPIGPPPA